MTKKIRAEVASNSRYGVIINGRVVFICSSLTQANGFWLGSKDGYVFSAMSNDYRTDQPPVGVARE